MSDSNKIDTRPAFMLDDSLTEVDLNDPVYQAVAARFAGESSTAGTTSPPDASTYSTTGDGTQSDPAVDAQQGEGAATVDTAPVTGQASADAQAGQATGGDAEQPAPSPSGDAPATLPIDLPDGTKFDLTAEQAKYLLSVHTWIDQQPAPVKDAWNQIAEGKAVAIPASEAAAFRAWQAAGAPSPTAGKPDLSHLDDAEREYVERLEKAAQQAAALPQPVDANSPAALAAQQQRIAEQNARNALEVETATREVAATYGLDAAQQHHLQRAVAEMGIIPAIASRHRVLSPSGAVINEGNFGAVIREAFETAMIADPTLRPIRDKIVVQRELATSQELKNRVEGKKANASTLATAPSAAVPGRNLDVRTMTPEQRTAAMVAELTEAMKNGE